MKPALLIDTTIPLGPLKEDFTGRVINGRKVLGYAGMSVRGAVNRPLWNVVCLNCKKKSVAYHGNLVKGHGCYCESGVKTIRRLAKETTDGVCGRKWQGLRLLAGRWGKKLLLRREDVKAVIERQGGVCRHSGRPISFAPGGNGVFRLIDQRGSFSIDNVEIIDADFGLASDLIGHDKLLALCRDVAERGGK